MIVVKVYKLPPRFYWDHVSRGLAAGTLMRETHRHVLVELDRDEYDALLAAAAEHSAGETVEDNGLLGLAVSARVTARLLRDDPFPTEQRALHLDEPVLSGAQFAVLRFLCVNGWASAECLCDHAEARMGTLASLVHLGLVERREAGARTPLYHLTSLGRGYACVKQDEPYLVLADALAEPSLRG